MYEEEEADLVDMGHAGVDVVRNHNAVAAAEKHDKPRCDFATLSFTRYSKVPLVRANQVKCSFGASFLLHTVHEKWESLENLPTEYYGPFVHSTFYDWLSYAANKRDNDWRDTVLAVSQLDASLKQ